ncbi:MAG: LysM peptidoglycan-binding domain-containing protein [Steroidobacteraceae bacterium]
MKNFPEPEYYVVKQGDTLPKIAEEFYGDESLYIHIFVANRSLLEDPRLIQPGQKLLLP